MNFFKGTSIRTKIITLVIAALIVAGAGSLLSLTGIANSYEKKLVQGFAEHAKTLGHKISTQFYERYGDVQAFAVNETVKRLDAKSLPSLLDSYIGMYGLYDLVLVIDKNGKYVASNTKDAGGKPVDFKSLTAYNFSEEPWFKETLAGKTTDDKEKSYSGTYFQDFLVDPVASAAFGESRIGSSFTAPIKNDKGEVVGIITNRAGSRWVENEFKIFYESLQGQGLTTVDLLLANKEGLVLVDYDPSENGGKLEPKHDMDTLFKYNVVKNGHPLAIKASQGQSGADYAFHQRLKVEQLTGYHYMDNWKWPKDIGWFIFVRDDKAEALASVNAAMRNFYIIFSMSIFIAVALATFVGLAISKSLGTVTSILVKNSADVADASTRIASASTELSEAATEQAAAIQETMAAIDEISAMVEKNADAASQSRNVSIQSREAAERGQKIVSELLRAVDDIDHSNNEVSTQMTNSNQQLSEITGLIQTIGTKTKVINEIVFQTKLLSFNASVEAARAGEYGKGFAVVAEEVGNLAQMSGAAAKEISALLESSVQKVEGIVNTTKSRVESLMTQSKEKIRVGADTAQECNKALDEILNNVQSVDSLVAEISTASTEQSTGIREISKAIGQMETAVQQNSAVAQQSSTAGEQLRAQSVELKAVVEDLAHISHGHNAQAQQQTRKTSTVPKNASQKVKEHAKVLSMKRSTNRDAAKPVSNKTTSPAPVDSHADLGKHQHPVETKMASGSDFVPSSEDPGFKE